MRQSIEFVNSEQELVLPKLQVYRAPFDDEARIALHEHILAQAHRKINHPLTDPSYEVPEPIKNALPYVPFLLRATDITTKRYFVGEGSAAFRLHRDPEKFAAQPRTLNTLGGRALLAVFYEDQHWIVIDCVPNTAVVVHDNPSHVVTPPMDNKARTFMFSGVDAAKLRGKN